MKRLFILFCCAGLAAQGWAQTLRLNEILANSVDALGGPFDGVELHNSGATAVNLAGWSLSDSASRPRKYVFPANSFVPAGGFLAVTLDPSSTNNSFGLKAGGDTVYLFDSLGAEIERVTFGIQAADFSIGRVPDGSGNWTLTKPSFGSANSAADLSDAFGLKINEWMASAGGNNNDYFEVFNTRTNPVALEGLVLLDTLFTHTVIPPLSFIGVESSGFVEFIADGNAAGGANHVGFKLTKAGDTITLTDGSLSVIDTVTFGAQTTGLSEGRLPDGGSNIIAFPNRATPGGPNIGKLTNVVVNELLTHTDPPLEDAVELLNLSGVAINIGGWFLSDRFNELARYRIPNGTVIPAHGYKVIYEIQFNDPNGSNPTHPFTYNSAHGGSLFLTEADGNGAFINYLERTFPSAENGVSFGRLIKSDGGIDFTAMACRSFGQDNPASLVQFRLGLGATNACGPKVGPVIISELMFQPPDFVTETSTNDNSIDEFIELRNVTGAAVPLYDPNALTNHWRLDNGVTYEFSTNDVLPAFGVLLVVNFDPATNTAQLAALRSKYAVPTGVRILGPYGGKLDNNGETIELFKPDPPQLPPHPDAGFVPYILADKVKFNDHTPWPTNATGTGLSLQRVVGLAYGNDPTNWFADVPSAGRANVPFLAFTLQPTNQLGLVGGRTEFFAAVFSPTPHFQWFHNKKKMPGATNATLTLTNLSATRSKGTYFVQVMNFNGSILSQTALLQVITPVKIIRSPRSRTLLAGKRATFTVSAKGTAPLKYQWWQNGLPLLNATNKSLVISGVQESHEGSYSVTVSNVLSGAVSAPATLIVNP